MRPCHSASTTSMALTRWQILLFLVLGRRFRGKNKNCVKKETSGIQNLQERKEKGEFHLLVQEVRIFDHHYFFPLYRISPIKFKELLN